MRLAESLLDTTINVPAILGSIVGDGTRIVRDKKDKEMRFALV